MSKKQFLKRVSIIFLSFFLFFSISGTFVFSFPQKRDQKKEQKRRPLRKVNRAQFQKKIEELKKRREEFLRKHPEYRKRYGGRPNIPAPKPHSFFGPTPVNRKNIKKINNIKMPGAPRIVPPGASQRSIKGNRPVMKKTNISKNGIKLQYSDVDLYDFIDIIAGVLGINYIIDPSVQGKVNINMVKPVPKQALMDIFVDILRINNATVLKSGDIYHIIPLQASQTYPSSIEKVNVNTEMLGSELTTAIIPIQFVDSESMSKLLDEFKTPKASIINVKAFNILIVTDFKDNIRKLLDIIKILDTEYFKINKIELIPVKYNKASDVTKDLQTVFFAAGKEGAVKFVPIDRMNSILCLCHSEMAFKKVLEWVNKLDKPSDRGTQTFVYKVENTTAANIAQILEQLYSDMGAQTSYVGAGNQEGINTGMSTSNPPGGGQTIAPRVKGTIPRSTGVPITGLSGNVKIITDDLNNCLIIQGTQADYDFLLKTIKKLDVLPRQVLLEVKVLRVDLTGSLSAGFSSWLEARSNQFPATQGSYTFGGQNAGLTISTVRIFGIGGSKEVKAVLHALETESKVEIMESPSILVLDGHEANINVGKEIPIATSTFTNPYLSGNGGTNGGEYNITNTQIQYRATGVNLSVSPRISASGIVTLEIAEEVSSPGNKDEGLAGSPPINRSMIETTMVVKDGNSIIIGGIISQTNEKSRSSVPLLGRIPILGWLFSSNSRSKSRTEMLVILTPYVINTIEEAKEVSKEGIHALKNINEYVEREKKNGEFGVLEYLKKTKEIELKKRQKH